MYDLIIKGGSVIDGTGKPAYIADVAINDGKIVSIKSGIEGGLKVIDANGLTVTPGFIDSHSHADSKILYCPEQREKIEQGITTSVSGQCGGSVVPVGKNTLKDKLESVTPFGLLGDVCNSFESLYDSLEKGSLGANFLCFIGHGTIRRAVIGVDDRAPSSAELEEMKTILRNAFEQGAAGLSFGLFYSPGCYADTAEALALAKVAKEYNRPVSAHIRTESDGLVDATMEFIKIVRESGCRGILSHHKAVQHRNWGKVNTTLQLLQEAVDEGVDIYCDVYPYCASSTKFSQAFVPNSWRGGGTQELIKRICDPALNEQNKKAYYETHSRDSSWILLAFCPCRKEFEGMTLDKIANILNMDPYDAAMKLIVDSNDRCNACFFSVSEDDLKRVMSWNRAMICTDSGMAYSSTKFHPRMVGSFPRAIGRYVRQHEVVSLEEMIRKMTSLPASVYELEGKGLLKEGYDADICIFDANKLIDNADFQNCSERAEGLNYVLLAGHIVVENATHSGAMYGKVICK